jgi:hypothetical protein
MHADSLKAGRIMKSVAFVALMFFGLTIPSPGQLDPNIINRSMSTWQVPKPIVLPDPLGSALKAQQLINMRLEAERQQLLLEAERKKLEESRSEKAPAVESGPQQKPSAPESGRQQQADTDGYLTLGLVNGRLWVHLSDQEKTVFLLGSNDALYRLALESNAKTYSEVPESLKPPPLQFAEVVRELDRFYSEGSNGPIPIENARLYIKRKAYGDSPQQLEMLLADLRKIAQSH